MSGPGLQATATPAPERGAVLALLPIAATVDYYALPEQLQDRTLIQLAPQLIAYLACALWAVHNTGCVVRLGLERHKLSGGLAVGLLTGGLLGMINSAVLLGLFPRAGYDITFLKTTPHGLLPTFIMVPWFICGIALFVEINFRGFLLGRLLAMAEALLGSNHRVLASSVAIGVSAFIFAFDPFMMHTFRHLHWIAVWDGLVWGVIWIHMRNLYATMTAHAVEVLILYSAVRTILSP